MDEDQSVGDLITSLHRRTGTPHRFRVWGPRLPPDAWDDTDLALLLRLASARLDGRLADHVAGIRPGTGLGDVEVLRMLSRYPRGGSDIAPRLGRSPQWVSRVLRRLEEDGLVSREPSWRDGRIVESRVTDRGLDLLDEVDARQDIAVRWAFEGAGPQARPLLVALLLVLADD